MNISGQYLGGFIGVEPGTTTVYHNRTVAGGWEQMALTPSPAQPKMFNALFTASGKTLSQQPGGTLQTRQGGTDGLYEQFFATNQPDGTSFLYRYQDGQILDVILIQVMP